jgi:hypothetical protein
MMNSDRLRRLIAEARSVFSEGRIVVFGSTSLLGTFPEIAEETRLFELTLDSDFISDPWSDDAVLRLQIAVGKPSDFFKVHGYYADIVRPDAYDQFPPGFQERLVPIPGFDGVFALDVHDMAVAKLWAGRPKDIALLSALLHLEKLDEAVLRKRLWDTPMVEKWIVKTHDVLERSVAEAKRLTESGIGAQDLQILP